MATLKEKEAMEWKEQTKREADSIEAISKAKEIKLLTEKDSLGTLINKDSLQIEDFLFEQSIKEIEDLIQPISD